MSYYEIRQIIKGITIFISVFCEYCLAVNPEDPKLSSNKIVFNVGCASERCVADLKLTSTVIEP